MSGRPVQRIVVALDASSHSHAALEEAAQLASGLEAELAGIFVLDSELLRLSALPVCPRDRVDLRAPTKPRPRSHGARSAGAGGQGPS